MVIERLQKFMAHSGVASRRKCEELIRAGKVKVNGKVIQELGTKVDTQKDIVEVLGKQIKSDEAKVYFLLNKPRGILSSVRDDRGRKTVVSLIKDPGVRLYPVGRLDYNTEGLLLLTNDGELTNRLIHPRYKVDKTYFAQVKGIPDKIKLDKLREGIDLEDGKTNPAEVKLLKVDKDISDLEITIHEGRNRQVRRMFDSIGHPVLRLKRIKFGFLNLGKLKPGEYRRLTPREVERLYNLNSISKM